MFWTKLYYNNQIIPYPVLSKIRTPFGMGASTIHACYYQPIRLHLKVLLSTDTTQKLVISSRIFCERSRMRSERRCMSIKGTIFNPPSSQHYFCPPPQMHKTITNYLVTLVCCYWKFISGWGHTSTLFLPFHIPHTEEFHTALIPSNILVRGNYDWTTSKLSWGGDW